MKRLESIRDAFGLVFVLVLTTYVLASLVENRGWGAVTLTVATSATSIVALVSARARPQLVRLACWLSALSVLLAAIAAIVDDHTLLNLGSAVEIVLLTLAMAAVLRSVLTAGKVGFNSILGALSVYAVLGILFTFLYGIVERVQSGNFFSGVEHPAASDFLFFSYTTLTTTGYGNLVPAGQPGRMLAGLEMMIGQIFLVTLVAGLVSLWRPGEKLRQRRGESEPAEAER